jgi:nucleotide-binding universal stress UspA family protein
MYKRILVPVDGSAASTQGLNEAIDLASHLKARLQLAHVVEPWVMVTPETITATVHHAADVIRSVGRALLDECAKKVASAGVEVDVELIETTGSSAGEWIIRMAGEIKADLIVCGTHGRRGVRRLIMGSDAEYIVRRAPVPVLLVRHQEPGGGETG